MRQTEIRPRQLWAWIAVAVSAPLAHFSGAGWFAVLLAAGAMLPLALLSSDGWQSLSKVEAVIEWIWLAVVLAQFLPASGICWPGAQTEWVVPLTLLVLAALSGGGERAVRVGSTLFWILILMYLPLAFVGASQVEVERLAPAAGEWTSGLLLTLLIPSLSGVWQENRPGQCAWTLGIGAAAVGFAAMIQGILSYSVAASEEAPFFELSRTMGRLEPLVAMALTFGWYQFAGFLMSTAARLGERFGLRENWARWMVFTVSAVLISFRVKIPGEILTISGLLLWVFVPMLHAKKISRKTEKRC